MPLTVKFNPSNNTITLNGELVSLHCHHFNCGLLKAIEDIHSIDGHNIIINKVADVFYKPFKARLADDLAGLSIGEILHQAGEMYRFMGFGSIDLTNLSKTGGIAYANSSYYVVGWMAKYGRRDTPVCYFTCGYIKAILAATFDTSPGTYDASETECMILGRPRCKFVVSRTSDDN